MNRTDRPARCAAVHDLSGLGRCSLSVILPAMSVMGVQVCPLPTAVLSTHTGGFGTPARRDLTDYLTEALAHYRTLVCPWSASTPAIWARWHRLRCARDSLRNGPRP